MPLIPAILEWADGRIEGNRSVPFPIRDEVSVIVTSQPYVTAPFKRYRVSSGVVYYREVPKTSQSCPKPPTSEV